MKQKEDDQKFFTTEKRAHSNKYDYTAPEERFDHMHRVRSLQRTHEQSAQMYQLQQQ